MGNYTPNRLNRVNYPVAYIQSNQIKHSHFSAIQAELSVFITIIGLVATIVNSAIDAYQGATGQLWGTINTEEKAVIETNTPSSGTNNSDQNTSTSRFYYGSGEAAYDRGDYDGAIADFTQAIRLDPNNAILYAWRGFVYSKEKGDYDRAIADNTQAIRLNPNYVIAYINRDVAYNRKGDWDRVIADCNQAIRLDPNDAAPYQHRGFAYMQKGNFTQARADINKALQLAPNDERVKDVDRSLRNKGY